MINQIIRCSQVWWFKHRKFILRKTLNFTPSVELSKVLFPKEVYLLSQVTALVILRDLMCISKILEVEIPCNQLLQKLFQVWKQIFLAYF